MGNHTPKLRLVYGVGKNDADYVVQPTVDGRQTWCPFYLCWMHMLERCYCLKRMPYQPKYAGCSVTSEWHFFSAFRTWMVDQDWKGKQIDKDLIGNGKLYSPENCVFVSSQLNTFFCDCESARGKFPVGVCWHKRFKKFTARVSVSGKSRHLGCFESPTEAHEAWYYAKLELAQDYLALETNERVRYAIECGINKLKLNFLMGVDR